MLNSTKKLLLYSLVGSFVSVPAIFCDGYHAEQRSNRLTANAESKEITQQQKSIDNTVKATAKAEHRDVEQTVGEKVDLVRQTYANSKDRNRALKSVKQVAADFHQEINERKEQHLNDSANLANAHLQESSDRHELQSNEIKRGHGKTVVVRTKKTAAPTDHFVRGNSRRQKRKECLARKYHEELVEEQHKAQHKARKDHDRAQQRATRKADRERKKAERAAQKAAKAKPVKASEAKLVQAPKAKVAKKVKVAKPEKVKKQRPAKVTKPKKTKQSKRANRVDNIVAAPVVQVSPVSDLTLSETEFDATILNPEESYDAIQGEVY